MVTVNGKKINFIAGMTVADAINAAFESADSMTIIIVDGIVYNHFQISNIVISDGAVIRLLPIISGG